jgi:DNA-binding IclR family transcriptional regulator
MHPTTVWRYIGSLTASDLLERDEKSGAYRLGLRVLELSSIVLGQLEVRKHAIDEMDKLRDDTGFLTNLAMVRGADVVHIAHSFPDGWPRWNMDLGSTAPANCTSLGKVLLSVLPRDEVVSRIEEAGWRPCTPKSITSLDRLNEELDLIAERGYAIDDEERGLGLMCVAVPVWGADSKVVAALSITGRVEVVTERKPDQIASNLKAVSRRISARMGIVDGPLAYL